MRDRAVAEAVADAAHRLDEAGGEAELAANVAHVDVDVLGDELLALVDLGEDRLARERLPGARHEEAEHFELGERELDLLPLDAHLVAREVELERADRDEALRVGGPAAAPPERDLEAREELGRA